MLCHIRKPTTCIIENKDVDQQNCAADQHFGFCKRDNTLVHLPKS